MSEKFEVGEVAILISRVSEYNGLEVTILSPLIFSDNVQGINGRWAKPGYFHEVGGIPFKAAHGKWFVRPQNLRKRKPPRETLGDWDLCPWRPGVKHEVHQATEGEGRKEGSTQKVGSRQT